MEKWKKRSVDLLTSLAFGSKGSPSVIPYYPQKTEISSFEERHFVRSAPEKHGISSKRIYNMLCELEAEKRANIHSLLVLCDGEVISECSREGYSSGLWHLSHSMSKTVTGMAVGLLIADEKLKNSIRLTDIFPEISYKDKRFSEITVEHLLCMTAGVAFNEAGAVTEPDWTESYFNSSMKFSPGEKFFYNSMNSYILARIVERCSNMRFIDFVNERIFSPLGIKNFFWEKSPEGIEKGGWGLYMSAESWAKLGVMMLSDGVFEGRRVLPTEWVKISISPHTVTPQRNGDFNYGYQLWVGRNSRESLFNGMLGQNVWICPKNRIVTVLTSGNNELFQDSPALQIIRKYLGQDIEDELYHRDIKVLRAKEESFFESRRWARPSARKKGILTLIGIKPKEPFDTRFDDILGTYAFGENNVGILPLFVRTIQNNLDSSIEEISFAKKNQELFMYIRESGESYIIPVGFYGYRGSVLNFRGEKYAVKAMAEAAENEDGAIEFRIEIIFPELPNTRYICIKTEGIERASFKFLESPNNKIAEAIFDRVTGEGTALGFAVDLLERRFGEGFIEKKLERTFSPLLIGANTAYNAYERIVEEQTSISRAENAATRLLRTVVDKFFKENTSEREEKASAQDDKPKEQKNLFSGLIEKIISSGKQQNAQK